MRRNDELNRALCCSCFPAIRGADPSLAGGSRERDAGNFYTQSQDIGPDDN